MNPFQAAVEAIDVATQNAADDGLTTAKAKALMYGYDRQWRNAGLTTLSVEETFHCPIINPETGRESKTATQAGKYDGIVSHEGKLYLLEHKTASDDISDPNAPYWRRLAIDSQVSMYTLANWQDQRKLDGTLYDVIRKPTIRPKKLSTRDRQLIVNDGTYYGFELSFEKRQAVSQWLDTEDAELYFARLARDTATNPQKYFQRRVITRLDRDVLEWAYELWDVARDIHETRKHGRHYRNSGACMEYGRPCEFLGICSGYDDPDSSNWKPRELHGELDLKGEHDGRKIITNSRVRCFQSCRRKHYYRYELGIERADAEEKEALYFGTVMHTALEAWFSCFFSKELSNGNETRNGPPVNGIGEPDGEEVVDGGPGFDWA